jgi:hypothetical protein
VLRIGELDASTDNLLFGYVLGGTVSHTGHVVVVDEDFRNARVFDSTGRFLARTGRLGSGPGEVLRPLAAATDLLGNIHVLDAGNSKVVAYRMSGQNFALASESRLQFSASDICTAGSRRYLLSSEGPLVREIDASGKVVREFGRRHPIPNELRRTMGENDRMVNYWRIQCHDSAGLVILANRDFGLLVAYDLEGREVWRRQLSDWRQQGYRPHPGGRCCEYNLPDPRTGTFSYVSALGAVGEGQLAVVVSEMRPSTMMIRFELRYVDVRDGRELVRQRNNFGPTLQAIRPLAIANGWVVATVSRPFPQVWLYRIEVR